MKVIFYGNRFDKFPFINSSIRWWTSSLKEKFNGKWRDSFSHCELLFDNDMMFSASQYENNTRYKKHSLTGKAWVRVEIRLTTKQESLIVEFCNNHTNKKYDYLGILGFLFGNNDSPNRWFCSEIVTEALIYADYLENYIDSSRVSPNKLFKLIKEVEDDS